MKPGAVQTIGSELEAGFCDSQGRFVDTQAVLGERKETGRPFECVTSDMARSSIEFVTGICTSGAEVTDTLTKLIKLVPDGYRPVFETRPFGDGPVELARKSRAEAMIQALMREHPEGARGVKTVAPRYSTQFHIGMPDVLTDSCVRFLDLLNNISPYARLQIVKRYHSVGTEGHLKIWHGWADESRLPAPRSFGTTQELHLFLASVPKLLVRINQKWRLAPPGTYSSLEDQESMGTIWWLARPRFYGSATGPTIEWRPFPSMPAADAGEVAGEVLLLAKLYRDYISAHPVSSTKASSDEVRALYAALAERTYLVPSAPLSDAEWWKLFAV